MRIRILLLLLLALAACSPGPFSTPQATTALPHASPTPVRTQTPTLVPTETPTATASPVPAPESSPIATPSDMKEPALELLRTNNGCKLSCWWGITPGTTTWADAQEFLELFSKTLDVRVANDGWLIAEVYSPIEREYSPILGGVRLTLGIQNGIVQEIDAHDFDEPSWHLDSLLQQYGPPGEVYMYTYSRDSGLPANTVPFSIALFYPDKGLLAMYGTMEAQVVGSRIRGCLGSPSLFLWNPEKQVTFAYASQWKDTFLLPLEQATGMDINQFYETYKNGGAGSCIETPVDLWPEQ